MTAIQSVVRGVYKAYEAKDRAAIEALLADDFHFTSPLDNRLDRATYFKVCWPNSESAQRFALPNLAVDGDKAFVTYEARWTHKGSRSFRTPRSSPSVTARSSRWKCISGGRSQFHLALVLSIPPRRQISRLGNRTQPKRPVH